MHPGNVRLLSVAQIDSCVLSNNHVIDLGFGGLVETLETLRRAGIQTAGAGKTLPGQRRLRPSRLLRKSGWQCSATGRNPPASLPHGQQAAIHQA